MTPEQRAKLIGQTRNRSFSFALDRAHINREEMTVKVSLSSEEPAPQFFGTEILIHTKAAIDMSRAGSPQGLPLLLGHNRGVIIGRAQNIKLAKRRLIGLANFSSNTQAAREAWADVDDEILVDVSLNYRVLEANERMVKGQEVVEITRWMPLELSIVTVPADSTVGFNREDSQMTAAEQAADAAETARLAAPPAAEPPPDPIGDNLTVANFQAARTAAAREGATRGASEERQRVSEITRMYDLHASRTGVADLRQACITEGTSPPRAGALLLEFIAGDAEPIGGPARAQDDGHHGTAIIPAGGDESDKWIEGMTSSLEVRGGLITDREARRAAQQNEFYGMSLVDMCRNYLERQRISMKGLTRQDIAGQAFTRAGQHGTSDFSNILENVANKALLIGYDEAPETWQTWARTGSLSDFKVASRVNISSFSDLEQIIESGEYKEGHLSDLKETIQLAKYGKTFTISREAIINDDLDAFTRIPQQMGRAGARKVGDIAYNILIDNPTLNQDATALFAAGHSNLGTGGVITETTLDEFGKLLAAQTSPAPGPGETGAKLNLSPTYLLVPRAILKTALKQTETLTAPDTTGDLSVNTQRNTWTVVWDSRLDANSLLIYYALAATNLIDTVEVAFLDGNSQPFMESKNGFEIDGVTFKVRVEAAAAALDFRGMARNAGA